MTLARALPLLVAAAAGACTVFAFAPFGVSGLALATTTFLFWQWLRAPAPRDAAAVGFAFGVGLFGAGASWLYIAIQQFVGMPPWLAFVAIAVLVAYLALWPAAAGWIAARFAPPGSGARLVIAAGAFTVTEWIRSYLFTGFPWLALGYSAVPDGLFAGYAPAGGVYLITLVILLSAAFLAFAIEALPRHARVTAAFIVLAVYLNLP